MSRFTGIPALPQSGVDEWQFRFLDSVKQNVELLTGTRGEPDRASQAILRSTVTTQNPPSLSYTGLTARGAGVTITISGAATQVPTYTDYAALLRDVRNIGNDVQQLRATLDALMRQLKG